MVENVTVETLEGLLEPVGETGGSEEPAPTVESLTALLAAQRQEFEAWKQKVIHVGNTHKSDRGWCDVFETALMEAGFCLPLPPNQIEVMVTMQVPVRFTAGGRDRDQITVEDLERALELNLYGQLKVRHTQDSGISNTLGQQLSGTLGRIVSLSEFQNTYPSGDTSLPPELCRQCGYVHEDTL